MKEIHFSSKQKLLYYKDKEVRLHKSISTQIDYHWNIFPMIEVSMRCCEEDCPLYLYIQLFGLFNVAVSFTEQQDHAGLRIAFTVLCFNLHWDYYDQRHWDYDNNCWEK